jgi:antitoxin (DNA-binding transcriptional repressor) of toxin-antitoxin stability system
VPELKTQTRTTREVRANLSEIIMQAHYAGLITIVTHHGRKYAALVPLEVAAQIDAMLAAQKAA